MSKIIRALNLGTVLSLSVTFLLNSIRFYEEARNQVTINQHFLRSITWYSILLVIGMLLFGIFVGILIGRLAPSAKKKK